MAASNSSRSRGVHVEDMPWGLYARGTREALIQHGFTRAGPFPGDPGEKKTTCETVDQQGREIRIRRSSKTTFSVSRDWSEDEKAVQVQKQRREQEIQAARALVASWPKSSTGFRERAAGRVDTLLQFVEAHCTDGMPSAWAGEQYGGYRFDDATIARVYALSDELLEVVKAGGVVLDIELRKKQTPACIAEEVPGPGAAHAHSPIQYGGNVVPFRKPCNSGPKPL
ncbi:MAG: hypothetical protein Q7U80_06560 [Thiobacillus sp.]|nr:hypothetical protein [Thiobacillus sp.]